MKTVRALLLLMAVSCAYVFPVQAQQEVDPDHFDGTSAKVQSPAHSSKAVAHHHHSQAGHVNMASKHSSKHHHHAQRASA